MKRAVDLKSWAIFLLFGASVAGGCNAIFGIDQAKSDSSGLSGGGQGGMSASAASGHGGMSAASGNSGGGGGGGGAPTCLDGSKNGSETDVDCGGSCPPCANTKACGGLDANCVSMICANNVCVPPAQSCMNGMKDGKETDVDCGGPDCKPCADTKACQENGDCLSLDCKNGICAPAACNDGIKNGSETDVDCGGACAPCLDGKACAGLDANCQSQKCVNNVCAPASCNDGIRNGGESDVDCGGPCSPCANGKECGGVDANCASMICMGNVCVAPPVSCMNGIKDGSETDVDCGGPSCQPCSTGKACGGLNTNCQSQHCQNNVCVAATCMDTIKNGSETGVDCGGGACPACSNGQPCNGPGDCASMTCSANICVPPMLPTCMDGIKNGTETGVDCGGGMCMPCPVGQPCNGGSDCQTTVCQGGFCQPMQGPTCGDLMKNGSETDVDCGGGMCMPCAIGKACLVPSDCQSTYCDATFHCAVPQNPCMNGILDGNETDIDCGGGTCPPCLSGKTCNTNADCTSGMCQPPMMPSSSASFSSASSGGGASSTNVSSSASIGGWDGGQTNVSSSSSLGGWDGGGGQSNVSSSASIGGWDGGQTSVSSSSSLMPIEAGTSDAKAQSDADVPAAPSNDFGKGIGVCL